MKERRYTKDPYTGAVVFNDSDAFVARKKVIETRKNVTVNEKDSKKVINSLRNEVSELKNLVRSLLDQ